MINMHQSGELETLLKEKGIVSAASKADKSTEESSSSKA